MNFSLINWHMIPQNTPLGYVPCAGLDAAYVGLKSLGHIVHRTQYRMNGLARHTVCWGWRKQVAQLLRLQKKEVLVLELGYIGDRRKYISLGWNGLNGYAEFPEYQCDGGDRFRAHGGVLKPWKTDGDYILILGQVKGDASLQGKDIMPWYLNTAKKASELYGLPVYYRPHPESVRRRGYEELEGYKTLSGSLEDAIDGALFTIAYNSNSCLDSILAGVPCYAADKGTVAYELCMKDLSEIIRPYRESIVYNIAWKQWSLDELKSGEPFRKALEMKGIN